MDNYTIFERIGEGGFGSAYLAVQNSTGKRVVIKRISVANVSTQVFEACQNEYRILSKMHHPCIVDYITSFMDDESNLCIVMDHCAQGDLLQWMTTEWNAPVQENNVLRTFVQIVLAVEYMHNLNIMHRDIKPKNIFVDQGMIKLGDFGVSKRLAKSNDFTKTCVGTDRYMSPEILAYKKYNCKSDIWSLGVMLRQMINLDTDDDDDDDEHHCLNNECVSKSPSSLNELVRSMLSVDPEKRPTTRQILTYEFLRPCVRNVIQDCLSSLEPTSRKFHVLFLQSQRIGLYVPLSPFLPSPSFQVAAQQQPPPPQPQHKLPNAIQHQKVAPPMQKASQIDAPIPSAHCDQHVIIKLSSSPTIKPPPPPRSSSSSQDNIVPSANHQQNHVCNIMPQHQQLQPSISIPLPNDTKKNEQNHCVVITQSIPSVDPLSSSATPPLIHLTPLVPVPSSNAQKDRTSSVPSGAPLTYTSQILNKPHTLSQPPPQPICDPCVAIKTHVSTVASLPSSAHSPPIVPGPESLPTSPTVDTSSQPQSASTSSSSCVFETTSNLPNKPTPPAPTFANLIDECKANPDSGISSQFIHCTQHVLLYTKVGKQFCRFVHLSPKQTHLNIHQIEALNVMVQCNNESDPRLYNLWEQEIKPRVLIHFSGENDTIAKKRGPGRPRKVVVIDHDQKHSKEPSTSSSTSTTITTTTFATSSASTPTPVSISDPVSTASDVVAIVKRKPGRPRKHPVIVDTSTPPSPHVSSLDIPVVKKKRGRPRKNALPLTQVNDNDANCLSNLVQNALRL